MQSNFHAFDGLILVGYLVLLCSIGFIYSKKQSNLEVFFLAGRKMSWIPVGLSLMACLNSGIDYLMQPSAIGKYGLVLIVTAASWLALWPWVSRVTLPFYRRLSVYTAYEYLERRFDVRVRTLAASIFILWRLGWIATAMYVPCLAMSAATGGRLPIVPMIVVLGSVVTLYTVLGGMKAVIWTDVLQFFIMFGGLAATIGMAMANVPGGFAEVWTTASEAGKTSFAVRIPGAEHASFLEKVALFFKTDVTAWGLLIAALVGRMTVYTSDQVMVQRFQTTKSLKDARRAFIINAVGDAVWTLGLGLVGLTLFAYFRRNALPAGTTADRIFPYFMSQHFPSGAIGLVIAAIFAASLGAIGSAINSCTSVAVVDFYHRLVMKRCGAEDDASQEQQHVAVRVSRLFTLAVGLAAIVISSNVGRLGDLIEIAQKVIQLFTGALLGIYVLGMFTRRANSTGVLIGGLTGAGASAYVAFLSPLGFVWPAAAGLVATLAVGYGASCLAGPVTGAYASLTFDSVLQGQPAESTAVLEEVPVP